MPSKNKKSLAETHPEVAKQWHPTKNGDLTPNNVTPGSNKKAWWKCDKGDDHEWESPINRISRGGGCSICSGKTVVLSNCLVTLNPELAAEWHPHKNGNLTPYDVALSSNKKVWWKCPEGDDHEWESVIASRSSGRDCSVCSGKTVVLSNCLVTLNPELAAEWHPHKNGNLTPYDVTISSGKKVWWKCPEGDDHEWKSAIASRSSGIGCGVCSGQKTVLSNCLATLNPELAKQWHPHKNGNLTPYDVAPSSNKKAWWKCDKGDDHEWESPINRISRGGGCSICSGKTVVLSNCLVTLNPELAAEWHPHKNGNLTPYDVTISSGKKVWWKCPEGDDHEWKSAIASRSNGRGCSICRGLKVVTSNSLAKLNPELAKQWHPTLNGDLTPSDFTISSNKKVWWKCDKGEDHEWKTSCGKRSTGRDCPFCTLTPQSKQELTITFELMKLFKNINPKGLKTKLEGKLRAIDIFIPKLNLCIEFDGSYWHKDEEQKDKIKSEMLFEEGFKLVRVRQEPLEKLYVTDIISKIPYNGKQVTNDILSMIMSIFESDAKLVSKIKAYQSKDGLQNEKGLERYIDKILTEKAGKK